MRPLKVDPARHRPHWRRRIRVALGQEPGDLLITGGQVVNVFNRRVEPADVVIADGRIAGVGCYSWQAEADDRRGRSGAHPGLDRRAHASGKHAALTLPSCASLIVPMGTTAVISDSHELANVLGARGIEMLADASKGLPLDLFFMASSCVPATAWEDAGAVARSGRSARRSWRVRRVLGLAEVMDIPAVLAAQPEVLEKVQAALSAGAVVDGHAAGLAARDLIAYAAAGIRSDHESTTVEEARARAALGMLVQVREGSSAQNLDAILPLLASGELDECVVPGHRRHLSQRPAAPTAISTACSDAWSRAACRRPSRSGTRRTFRPGITVLADRGALGTGMACRPRSGRGSAGLPRAHRDQGRPRGGARRPCLEQGPLRSFDHTKHDSAAPL